MSNIEWTDTTWQVTSGCTKVSPGCASCYAETMANRLAAMARADEAVGRNPGKKKSYPLVVNDKGRWNGTVVPLPDNLTEPLHWKKPRLVFVNSMSDLFHESVPFEFIDRVFAVMALCPQHTFQVLTKRPERMAEYLSAGGYSGEMGQWWCDAQTRICHEVKSIFYSDNPPVPMGGGVVNMWNGVFPLPNVWLGTSVENHVTAAARIPHLQKCPAAVRFLSVEPQVDEIGWRDEWASGLHWMIGGGESGSNSRPYDIAWPRAGIAFARKHGIAWFQKQLGAVPIWDGCGLVANNPPGETRSDYVNGQHVRVLVLRDRKGGDMAEWSEDLRVREFPR